MAPFSKEDIITGNTGHETNTHIHLHVRAKRFSYHKNEIVFETILITLILQHYKATVKLLFLHFLNQEATMKRETCLKHVKVIIDKIVKE